MVCKHCGYQNSMEAKYCSGCGRKLSQEDRPAKKWLWVIVVCLLIAGIGVGTLVYKGGMPNRKTADIIQVLPMDDGSVAALYGNGTVKVSGNAQLSEAVSDWGLVTQLYYNQVYTWKDGAYHDESYLVGLTEDGSVITTAGNLSGWSNVKELYFPWQGVVGVTHDGRVLTYGDWEDDSFLTGLTNVEDLVNVGEMWGCLKKDGSVQFVGEYGPVYDYGVQWKNVKELRASDHGFYAIMKDGTVEGQFDDTYVGLKNAVKVMDFQDWIFGISADGRLLTHSGGNIYTNTGDLTVDVAGSPYYSGEVDISQFDQVRDIVPFWGLILLNEDGTAEHIGEYPHWNLYDWNNVQKVCGCASGEDRTNLYGVQKDGSVILNCYDWNQGTQTVKNQYRGWKLQDIYAGSEGVVGLTTDEKLVGDGIYENVDFSVFDR